MWSSLLKSGFGPAKARVFQLHLVTNVSSISNDLEMKTGAPVQRPNAMTCNTLSNTKGLPRLFR